MEQPGVEIFFLYDITCFPSTRSRQRVFATAESRRETQSDEVEREVVIKKTVHNVNMTNLNDTAVTASYGSSASRYITESEFLSGIIIELNRIRILSIKESGSSVNFDIPRLLGKNSKKTLIFGS